MRYRIIALLMLLCAAAAAPAQVSIGIGLPSVNIGINLGLFPELEPVPGYPVYYAPRVNSNYFFYDGMYWVYRNDDWYASSWYNGPWGQVDRYAVPYYVLRVPVRYYREPPSYFRGWQHEAPPRWNEHWGREWEQRRSDWDKWDRRSAPARAPLPAYQRQYSGDRYPRVEQQQAMHNEKYRYQPKEPAVREHYQQQRASAPPERGRQAEPPQTGQRPEAAPRPQPSPAPQQGGRDVPRTQPPQSREREPQGKGSPNEERNRGQEQRQENQQKGQRPEAPPRPQPTPAPQQGGRDAPRAQPPQHQEQAPQGKGAPRESRGGDGQERDHEKK